MVGPPAAMTYPASAEIRQARNLVGFGARMLQFIKHGLGQFRRDTFIGIDGKHPFTTGQVERPILLRTETRPIGREADLGALALGDLTGLIRAARVDDNDFVGEMDRRSEENTS